MTNIAKAPGSANEPPVDPLVDRWHHQMLLNGTGIIALLVILLQIYIQFEGYRRQLTEAAKLSEAIVRIADDQTQRTLQSISLILEATQSDIVQGRRLEHAALRERIRSLPEVRGMFLVGTDGVVLDSSLAPSDIGQQVGDKDYIQRLHGPNSPSIALGTPVMRRWLSGPEIAAHAFLPVAMRLPDDSGYLVAAVNIAFLDLQYQSLLTSSHAAVSLIGFDGTVLMDAQHAWGIGMNIANVDPIFDFLPGTESATFSRRAVAGKRAQIVSFRVTRSFPVIVVAAIDLSVIHKDWLSGVLRVLLPTMVAVTLVVVALLLMRRQLGHIAMQEQALRASRDDAEAASKAKSQFLAVMSHEIRTPMNAVLGLSSSLLDEPLNGDQHAAVRSIHDAGEGLLVLLNDILDYSRLEAGEIVLEASAFAPKQHLQSALDIITPLAAVKSLDVRVDIQSDLPDAVIGDGGRLRQVLINVAANAVKFTERGHVSVRLSCVRLSMSSARLEWSVSDTGIGIDPKRIQSIFRDFVQADSSIQRRFGGSGLGLAICRRIMDRLGGEIVVVSEPGVGTKVTFAVTLEVTEAGALKPRDEGDVLAELKARISRLGRRMRLLIVDDNRVNRVVAAKLLSGVDIEISEANDGGEGLRLACAEHFDAILMDTQMPGMDGLAATRAIRLSHGPCARAYVIAFTANAMGEDVINARDAGSDAIVTKPVRKQELAQALLQALDGGAPLVPGQYSALAKSGELPAFDPGIYETFEQQIGAEGMREIVAIFIGDAQARLAALEVAAPSHACSAIRRDAHTLKSSAATLGLMRMAGEAEAIEFAAEAGEVADLADRVARLRRAFEKGVEALPGSIELAA